MFDIHKVSQTPHAYHDRVVFCFDRTFRTTLPHWNGHTFFGRKIKHNPRIFGYPDFEHIDSLCTMRTIDAGLKVHPIDVTTLKQARKTVRFGEMLSQYGLEAALPQQLQQWPVEYVNRSFTCPLCGYPLLRPGIGYGAPVEILDIKYKRIEKANNSFSFGTAARFATRANPRMQKILAKDVQCRQMLASRSPTNGFVFFIQAEKMFFDGKQLTRGANACLLRAMLEEYHSSGACEFSRQWLLQHPALHFDPLNPNLEIRIQRLKTRLRKKAPRLSLTRPRKGLYRLIIKGCCNYSVQP